MKTILIFVLLFVFAPPAPAQGLDTRVVADTVVAALFADRIFVEDSRGECERSRDRAACYRFTDVVLRLYDFPRMGAAAREGLLGETGEELLYLSRFVRGEGARGIIKAEAQRLKGGL